MKPWLLALMLLPIACTGVTDRDGIADDGWTPLFNGRDLSGWSISLIYPMQGQFQHDRNPEPIFTVVEEDGEPAIHISGRIWGPLISDDDYENFHLRLEFKWGEKLWPPLSFRDTGVMYHSIGEPMQVTPDGTIAVPPRRGIWMTSMEYQITEAGELQSEHHSRDVGGAYVLGKERLAFDLVSREPRMQKPVGEWNVVDILCVGDAARHYLNGELVAEVERIRSVDGPGPRAHTRGKLQIQSESAEVFFRRIEIRAVDTLALPR